MINSERFCLHVTEDENFSVLWKAGEGKTEPDCVGDLDFNRKRRKTETVGDDIHVRIESRIK